ncbi:MAG: hypothetical protein GX951_01125 [Mollicutes bacterium]|nr:hypothetical protein [Mollicutes bacterium]
MNIKEIFEILDGVDEKELFDKLIAFILEKFSKMEIEGRTCIAEENVYMDKLTKLQKDINFYKTKLAEFKADNRKLDVNIIGSFEEKISALEKEMVHIIERIENDYAEVIGMNLKQSRIRAYNMVLEAMQEYKELKEEISPISKCQEEGHDFLPWELCYRLIRVPEDEIKEIDNSVTIINYYDDDRGVYYCHHPRYWEIMCQRCGLKIKSDYTGKDNILSKPLEDYQTSRKRKKVIN